MTLTAPTRPLFLLAVATLLILAGVLAARGAFWYQSADFFCLYQGARSLAEGRDPYDISWWHSVTGGVYPDPWRGHAASSCGNRYAYPLWTAAAMAPIGILPLELAASAWMALSIGAAVFGAAALWRSHGAPRRNAALFAALVFTSQPFWVLLVGGQMTGIMLGLVGALALWVARARESAAGLALALLALKPQLVVLTIPSIALRALIDRRRRIVTTAVAAGIAMVGVPTLLVPAWPLEWLRDVGTSRVLDIGPLATAWGAATDLLGHPAWGIVFVALVVGPCLLLARGLDMSSVLALSLPLSLLVAPHAWSYDYLVLAVSWAFMLQPLPHATPRARWALLGGVVILASPLPWLLYAVALGRGVETLSVLLPAGTALLVAAAARLRRPRDTTTSRGR